MNTLLIGTIVSRPKDGMVQHFGVVTGPDLVFHNTPERGEHESTVGEFAAGHRVAIRGRVHDLAGFGRRVWWRRRNPHPYHFLDNNCEHTLSALIGRPSHSPQLAGWLGLAAIVTVVGILIKE